jgi:hypothetical protein
MQLRLRYGLRTGNWFQRWVIGRWNGKVLYPFVLFAVPKAQVSDRLFRHELQHVYQVWRMGWFGFYLGYLWHGIRHGYRNHPFEVEANERENDPLTDREKQLKRDSKWPEKQKLRSAP